MQQISKQPAFELGRIVATPGALAALKKAGQQPGQFLTRHVNREWGHLSDEDRKQNDYSLEHAFRLLSSYRTNPGDKLWIITESGRSVIIHAYSEVRAAGEPGVVVVRHRLPGGKYLFRVVEPRCRPQGRGINVNWAWAGN